MNPPRVLLTGATGYIGRHMLEFLLKNGVSVTAIVRKRAGRVEERVATGGFPGLRVLEGDLTKPVCGLEAEEAAALKGRVDAVVHCAGMTQFDAHLKDELFRHNLSGTRNAFELALRAGASHFHHLSTAFVQGGPPKNPYEASKAEAEKFLEKARPASLTLSIYRPSIVVGGRVLGENGAAGTVYAYLKALRFLRECFHRDAAENKKLSSKYGASRENGIWRIPLRVEGDPQTPVNLVHVDDVVQIVTGKVLAPPAASGVYPLISRRVYPAAEIKEAFCRALGLEGIEWVPESFLRSRATVLEEKFARMTNVYKPYLFLMPVFEGAWETREVSLATIVGDFLKELEGREKASRLGALALDCLEAEKPARYLDKFSQGQFGESLLRRIPFVETKVGFRIAGDTQTARTILFEKGTVRELAGAAAGEADFFYDLDETVFKRIVTGDLDPREAFFKGFLKISGDQERALKFGYLFTEHFMDIDRRILEELEGVS